MESESDKSYSVESEEVVVVENKEVKKKLDIRRYYCEYCGISRSKRSLITSHMQFAHPEEAVKAQEDREQEERMKEEERKRCKECGVWFRKPAHLKQHMLSHSFEVNVFINRV